MSQPRVQSWENPRCLIFKEMTKTHPISADTCLFCKGRLFCGKPKCPLLIPLQKRYSLQNALKKQTSFFGPTPPDIFIGWKDYPNVWAGPLLIMSEDDPIVFNSPNEWLTLSLERIAELRTSLLRCYDKIPVKEHVHKLQGDIRDTVLSKNALDLEIELKKPPRLQPVFSAIAQPMGPSGSLSQLKIVDNPKIPNKIDSIVQEDLRASDGLWELYQHGFSTYYLQKIFSGGLLGLKRRRKLVPTRWSITAVDSILAQRLIQKIKQYPEISDFKVLSNEFAGNHVEVLFLPEHWRYEQLEAWAPGSLWVGQTANVRIIREEEGYSGRTKYALREGGGYYAIRFAVLEHLEKIRRQASVIVFREVSDEYYLPVGVWECREIIRQAKSINSFNSLKDALEDIQSRLRIPLSIWKQYSNLLNYHRKQRLLEDYL
ncbi:MAG: hypothetical protein ACFFDI_31525 [Promethearchaeota archaeon]